MTRVSPELDAFLRTEWRATVAAVARTTRDPGLAEDAVQDALARYLEAPPARVDNLAGWITVVARNLARDRQRSLASEQRALGRWFEAHRDDASRAPSELLDIRAALAALPERQREVCALRFLAGCSVEQVARELGVTTGTVKTQLHRARRRLAPALAA